MIPVVDEAEEIGGAVRSATAPGVEVVVVDGGSRDGTLERAEAAGARVVSAERGRARQLARGVEETTGDVVVFLHADTRLPFGFAPAIGEAMDDPAVVGGAFRFEFRQSGSRSRALGVVEWGTRLRVKWFGLPYGDQALFARRDVLERIGGVPDVELMEDVDLVTALKRAGRLVPIDLPATTSPRRYLEGGVARTVASHFAALVAWRLGVDRRRIAGFLAR